jgi:uncharacterized protein YdaU (DUF1376 family)
MALSFIAFHMRDYQRDTQQLTLEGHGAYFLLLQHCWTHGRIPTDDTARAAICKVTVQRWRKQLAPLVAGYFDADGENKRATVEIAKAEKLRTRQAMAGHNGAVEANKRKAARREMIQAVAQPRSSHGAAMVQQLKKEDITTTFSGAARARASPAETPQNPPENEPNQPKSQAANPVATPQGFAMEAREAVAKTAGSLGSGELVATIQAKGWVKP